MGIVNVTADSFSDGGLFLDAKDGVARGLAMLDEGADLVDVGGESTRPSATALTAEEEQTRVMPVLRGILAARPDAILSIDTYHAETAKAAVEAGAEIVNDVSGHLWDSQMPGTCATLGCGVVLMHTRGRPAEWKTQRRLATEEVTPLVVRELGERVSVAVAAGIGREAIMVDPGFGFGKILEENFALLAGMDTLRGLGFPMLAGVSRKSFLRRSVDAEERGGERPAEMEAWATIAANTAAVLAGAHVLRVHEVGPARAAAAVADRVLEARF